MSEVQVTVPELALLVGTRAALGAGLGLLLADCLSESQRKAVGWTLLLVGAVTTVPLAFELLGKVRASTGEDDDSRCLETGMQDSQVFDREATGRRSENELCGTFQGASRHLRQAKRHRPEVQRPS